MTAKKGDWVRIHSIIMKAADRAESLPDETRATDIQMWTKGFLLTDEARIGELVRVETYIGRIQEGTLTEVNPYYHEDFGKSLPELLYIGRSLRRELEDYDRLLVEATIDER